MFLTDKVNLIMALESPSYGVAGEDLVSDDFNVRVRELSYSPVIAEFRRKILNGHFDMSESVMGRQECSATFIVDLAPGATVTTEPQYSKLLQACGLKVQGWSAGVPVAVGSAVSGISWVTHCEESHTPGTMEIVERNDGTSPSQLVTRLQGAMGNVKFAVGTVGEPILMSFEFKGAFISMVDRVFGSILDPTAQLSSVPPAVLSATATVGGRVQDFDKFEIDVGNDLQEWIDPSRFTGNNGFYIGGKESVMTVDPTTKLLATDPVYTDWINGTPGAVSIALATAVPLTLLAPQAQYIAVGKGDRNRARIDEKQFLLQTAVPLVGNDTFELLQGSKS